MSYKSKPQVELLSSGLVECEVFRDQHVINRSHTKLTSSVQTHSLPSPTIVKFVNSGYLVQAICSFKLLSSISGFQSFGTNAKTESWLLGSEKCRFYRQTSWCIVVITKFCVHNADNRQHKERATVYDSEDHDNLENVTSRFCGQFSIIEIASLPKRVLVLKLRWWAVWRPEYKVKTICHQVVTSLTQNRSLQVVGKTREVQNAQQRSVKLAKILQKCCFFV